MQKLKTINTIINKIVYRYTVEQLLSGQYLEFLQQTTILDSFIRASCGQVPASTRHCPHTPTVILLMELPFQTLRANGSYKERKN